MTNKQQGFTLIELVAVIVILGALAVVALPRFVDLQDEAEEAATQGVAGALASAAAINYAALIANDDQGAVTINACDLAQFNGAMQSPISSSDYTLAASGGGTLGSTPARGASFDCQVEGPSSTVTFTAIATS